MDKEEEEKLRQIRNVAEIRTSEYIGSELKFFENRIEQKWLSTEEAACLLRVSSNAVRIMVHRGQIRYHKFGRRLRFTVADCMALFTEKGV